MNTKELIASELASVIDSLDQEAILNLLETPKNSEMGDIAFPAFSLAKVERKAPQMIAADIAEKINSQDVYKRQLQAWSTGPRFPWQTGLNPVFLQSSLLDGLKPQLESVLLLLFVHSKAYFL